MIYGTGNQVDGRKAQALKLPPGKAEQRIRVEPGLYIHLRRRSDGAISKQWQYRAQVQGRASVAVRSAVTAKRMGLGSPRPERNCSSTRRPTRPPRRVRLTIRFIAARFARQEAKEQLTVADAFKEWVADKKLGSARKGGKPVRQRSIDV